ncbi:LysR family transcriptional regulator [Hahella aquimaris]|uniref:LysR family transcriptional regulator n=1 Tax=Hahella sp. HNIBRBA332 TaxID=3015983 RepID=UPI00273C52FB|nr:LysR family transcriptional regulator [Hahella sp. HNIBRBA332]WLQ13479.1 LysR family transcriptional regulator [Hahella sp. HNIBRBA332]
MTREQLRIFAAVVSEGGFRAAAKKFYRSQSAISKTIRALEEEIGFQLFQRDRYRPKLTEKGEAFSGKVNELLAKFSDLDSYTRELAMGYEPVIRVAVNHICPLEKVLPSLRECAARYANTQVDFYIETLEGAMQRLQENQADIAITYQERVHASLEVAPFSQIVLKVVATPDYLANLLRCDNGEPDLCRSTQIVVEDSAIKRLDERYLLVDNGGKWAVNDHNLKKRMILAGLGWGRLPLHEIKEELAQGELLPMPHIPCDATEKVDLYVLRKLEKPHGPAVRFLWESLTRATQRVGLAEPVAAI